MSLKKMNWVAFALLVAGAGCAQGGSSASGSTGTASSGVSLPDAGPADAGAADAGADRALDLTQLEDAQLLFVADTLNAGEIEQARVALPKVDHPDVRQFALDMLVDHQAARDSLLELSDNQDLYAAPSRAAVKLVARAAKSVYGLLRVAAPADEAYIDGQVEAHTQALALFDQLVLAADDLALQALFVEQRSAVELHLERATTLERTIDEGWPDAGSPAAPE